MCQHAAIVIVLLFVVLQQQPVVIRVQQACQACSGCLRKWLHGFAFVFEFRGIDANETYPTTISQLYRVAVIDIYDVHTFAGVIGRAGSCQRRPVQVDGQDDE
jgi:hypothetical protein